VAERMAVLVQRLEAAYRSTVAPQVEELRSLDQSVDSLRKRLEELETQAQIAAWHREARAAIDRAEAAGIDEKIVQSLSEQLASSRAGVSSLYDWKLVENRFMPPDGYGALWGNLQTEIQERIRALLARDITSLGDDKTPPKYQELVERYYEVLSNRQEQSAADSATKPFARPAGARPKKPAATPP
jgi:chromosome segregation ATPase